MFYVLTGGLSGSKYHVGVVNLDVIMEAQTLELPFFQLINSVFNLLVSELAHRTLETATKHFVLPGFLYAQENLFL